MHAWEELLIEIPGFTIAGKAWGDRQGKPVLCLHGMLDNAASFDLIAPLLSGMRVIALDLPGNGASSHYPSGVLPSWKNDAFLLLACARKLGLRNFDIIAHSYGSLPATLMAISEEHLVDKMVFLDILGPKINFLTNYLDYLRENMKLYLGEHIFSSSVYPDREAAIQDRMKSGPISYQAAKALVGRGAKATAGGIMWTYDHAWRYVSSSLPHEDELRIMLGAITKPVLLIRADQGVPYPAEIFSERERAIKNLNLKRVPGGHHVHMDDPHLIAPLLLSFLR